MNLSMSNIAWNVEDDAKVYSLMQKYGYTGLEIAPTKIFSDSPYDKSVQAETWSKEIKKSYGFSISSMQSIWFGRNERLFGSEAERNALINHTKKAIDFASAINCKNLVFGCPKNRILPKGISSQVAVSFFKKLGDYAATKGTVIGIEAVPIIYNTNYINNTAAALNLVKMVDSKGFKLNLDVGAILENKESVFELTGQVQYINHIHISEPALKPIERRNIHNELRNLLENEGYSKFISIEMATVNNLHLIESALQYVKSVFG